MSPVSSHAGLARQDGADQLPTSNAQLPSCLTRVNRWRFIAAVVTLFLLGSRPAFACPMCFGAKESGLIDGAKFGVLALLLVLLVVQGAFVAFFIYLRNRAKQTADIDLDVEWLELQRGSTTT